MDTRKAIVAIDQGTSGSTVVVLDEQGRTLARANRELKTYFPKPGWVEQEPEEIWESVLLALAEALDQAPFTVENIAAIGISNQRETCMIWDRQSGRVQQRALVWQDRRTSERCAELSPKSDEVRRTTGLVIDPYFSASKLEWMLRADSGLARAARAGHLCMTTVDGFLVERLTHGRAGHGPIIEATNASRTLLMDLKTQKWSPTMCDMWGIPFELLPQIVPSAGIVGHTKDVPGLPDGIPISGIAGDQHAALFGQGCVNRGDTKCTYGTGAFVLCNTGTTPLSSHAGLLSTLAWQIGKKPPVYALEGACFIAGAAVQWLRDGLGIISSASDIEELARSVDSTGEVTFVPALSGLGAPYWDPDARGLICGITRGTTGAHLARATLEAIAFQVDDLLRVMQVDVREAGASGLSQLRVDGGACQNDLLLQLQADVSGLTVYRPTDIESTARGAGLLAGLGIGLFTSEKHAAGVFELQKSFESSWDVEQRRAARERWEEGVARARSH